MKNNTRLVTGFWTGETLPEIPELCIRSFLDHGHKFQLFSYKEYPNIPPGTILRDASQLIPENDIFVHHSGSHAPFADWIRCAFLYLEGGMWVDMDVICLSPDIPGDDMWFALQEKGIVGVAVMAMPPNNDAIRNLMLTCEDPSRILPWDSKSKQARKKRIRQETPDLMELRKNIPWGEVGPYGVSDMLQYYNILESAAPPESVYPLYYNRWEQYYDGSLDLSSPLFQNSWAIHVWGEMRRLTPGKYDHIPRGSIISNLLERHRMISF